MKLEESLAPYFKAHCFTPMVRNAIKEGAALAARDAYLEGTSFGNQTALNQSLMLCLLTLNREFGFGPDRCARFVRTFDKNALDMFSMDDLEKAVQDECKVHITL